MAHKNVDYKPEDIQFPNQKIVQSELVHEMQSSYIEYAMSVIVGRALPDVRDGLKPVHRRILYAMYEDGLTSDKPFKKSATCVGDVLGRYHPHGDASVYDALVRLAQDFSMRYMLVDGHGNFGSIDGDPPAAYRYTEARMSKIANEMLRDIDKETVDWDPNFDESRKEPRVLPARFPNLLVNGSSGIAVGMATNIPPHNLTEVINACVCVLDNPEATLYDLMQHVTGPDFPTKGIIMGRSGIRAAYATGRGKIILRARTEFEEFGRDRTRIIVTELPYQVNKRMLIKNMADQVNDKRLEGISDIRDETDRTGMRIVIEVKHDANPQVVLNRLFAQTQLQTSFAINMLALVDNQKQPKILSLRHIIDEYLTFQEELITRRTQYDLKKAREREHLLQGLLIAQDNIDEVIHIIRTSYDDAKEKLMERFSLSDVQAQAILDMRLKALQGLDREKLQNEYDELEKKIAYFVELLSNEAMLKGVLKDELIEIRDKYGDERKTEIQDVEDEIDIEDLIEEEQCVFTLTQNGYIKRTGVSEYAAQGKGGMGKKGITTREEDTVVDVFTASTHDYILFFTDTGKVYRKKGYQIPESGKAAKGTNIVNIIQVETGERVQAMLHFREKGDEKLYLTMVTRNGTVKRLPVETLKNLRSNGIRALSLDEGDELVAVRETDGSQRILIEEEQCVFTLTQNGYIKRTGVSEYAAQGKGGMGKKGITTREEDTVVDVFTASTHDYILFFTDTGKVYRKKGYQIPESGKAAKGTNIVNIIQVETGERVQAMLHFREKGDEKLYLTMVTRNGTVKRLPVETLKNLRSNGIRALSLDEGDELVAVRETDGSQRILIATHDGMACVFDETDVRAMGRTAVGVRGIRLREGDYVVGAARAQAGKQVLSITENGFGKKTPVEEYRITNRGGLGIKNYSVTEKTGGVVGVKVVDGSEDLLLVTRAGILIRTPVADIRTTGRATQGVIVMRFKEEGDQVISMALAEHEEAPAPETAEVPTPVENADE